MYNNNKDPLKVQVYVRKYTVTHHAFKSKSVIFKINSKTFAHKIGMFKIHVYTWTKSYQMMISTDLFFMAFGLAQGRQSDSCFKY